MGLFSKLVGDISDLAKKVAENSEGTPKNKEEENEIDLGLLVKSIVGVAQDRAKEKDAAEAQLQQGAKIDYSGAAGEPSGESWGPVMPAEENQYNFPGTYKEYFESIFKADFAEFKITREKGYGGNTTVYRFYERDGEKQALVVELLSRKSNPEVLRRNCRREGIPYLRFYTDYEGWWNTRSYVVRRMNAAIGR